MKLSEIGKHTSLTLEVKPEFTLEPLIRTQQPPKLTAEEQYWDGEEVLEFPNYFAYRNGNIYRKKKNGELRKLKTIPDKDGYGRIHFRKNNKSYNRSVSSIILETFVGPRPEGYEVCHGINGNSDDSLDNLSWGTRSKNMGEDKLRDGTDCRGEKSKSAKLSEQDVLKIREWKNLYSIEELAKLFETSYSNILNILNRKTWAWL